MTEKNTKAMTGGWQNGPVQVTGPVPCPHRGAHNNLYGTLVPRDPMPLQAPRMYVVRRHTLQTDDTSKTQTNLCGK